MNNTQRRKKIEAIREACFLSREKMHKYVDAAFDMRPEGYEQGFTMNDYTDKEIEELYTAVIAND